MPSVADLRDHLNLTRNTELQKGGWVSLSSPLPDYPFYSILVPRIARRSSQTYAFTITQDEVGKTTDLSDFFVGVGSPIQPVQHAMTKRTSVSLAKARQTTTFAEDQEELQGTAEEQLADEIAMIKAEQLDLPLLTKKEFSLAREPASSTAEQEVFGLPYWLPHDASATDIALYGGGNPANHSGGAAGITVAEAPRWAHAVGGFDKVSDSDLFDKLNEYHIRVNAFVPEGVNAIDSPTPNRCILCQHPVYVQWARLQQAANDNPGRDLGIFRDAIWFGSIPVKWWPAISEPDSPTVTTGYGLLYDLDLTTFKLVMHSTFGGQFNLQVREPSDQPGVIWLVRDGYYQLVCVRRNRNLVMYTDTASLISKAS